MAIYSALLRRLKGGAFTVTGEIEPERGADIEDCLRAALYQRDYVVAVNVTDLAAARLTVNSLLPACIIQERLGIETVLQLTCRDRNRLALQSDILSAAAAGIKNMLALTGDHTIIGDYPEAMPVFDLDSSSLVYVMRKMVDEGVDIVGHKLKPSPKFHIGVAAQPGTDMLEPEILKLKRKVKLGAEFVQTQAVYSRDVIDQFLDTVRSNGIKVPILMGVAPIFSYKMARWMIDNVPGIIIPDEMLQRLKAAKKKEEREKEGIKLSAEIVHYIRESTNAAGVHLMAIGYEYLIVDILRDAYVVPYPYLLKTVLRDVLTEAGILSSRP